MADSLGVGFRYEEIYEMCQAAVVRENERYRQKDTRVELAANRQRKTFKNSFKYQENDRRYRKVQMSVRIVGGICLSVIFLS